MIYLPGPAGRAKDRLPSRMIDIREEDDVIDAINAVLNNKGIAEVKNEKKAGKDNLVVVEISRTLKTKRP